jgi:hypothetical protein
MTPQQYAAMCGAALMGSPAFLSGGYGSMAGMADISGAPFEEISGAAFLSGADPVSALLGMGPGMDMSGFNPLQFAANLPNQLYQGLTHLNPFDSNFFLRSHPAAHPAVNPVVAQAIRAKQMQNGAGVTPHPLSKSNYTISPVTATVVGAGLNANISANPQQLFRPERFVIPASLAPSFTIQDIKVGNVSQFPNAGDIPGEMFAQNSFGKGMRLDTVNPAINLQVSCTNITGGSLTFRAGFEGTMCQ